MCDMIMIYLAKIYSVVITARNRLYENIHDCEQNNASIGNIFVLSIITIWNNKLNN